MHHPLLVCIFSIGTTLLISSATDQKSSVTVESSEWVNGTLVTKLKVGEIVTTNTMLLAEKSKTGNRDKGFFAEGLSADAKPVCRLYGRDGNFESIWFYFGSKRLELKRKADGSWEGKEFPSDAKTLF